MPNGRSSAVRSHRRPRKRRATGWVVIPLVALLAGAGSVTGWQWLQQQRCTGSVTARLVAPDRTAALLRNLAETWALSNPAVAGTCVHVQVQEQEAAVTADQLSQPWDETAGGAPPDVWVPPSSLWARAASASSRVADRLLPDRLPSVARSPVVIAMPQELAEELDWPETTLTWSELLDTLVAKESVTFGMSNPAVSTAGLLALSAIIDADDNSEVDEAEFGRVFTLERRVKVRTESTAELFEAYVSSSGTALSAFPALEQDVVAHNLANPELPLVAVYPNDVTTEADHPFLVLQSDWSAADRVDAAKAFLDFTRSEAGRQIVLTEGFRDSNRIGGAQLNPQRGAIATLTALPRSVLLADSIRQTVNKWTALTRPTNMLLVLDVSGSMSKEVPGTGQSRLDLTKAAAKQAVNLFGDDAQVGLWKFSADRSDGTPHQELVATGELSEPMGNGTRRDELIQQLDQLYPGGNTGMYDTVWAAYEQMQQSYLPSAENIVVVLTDGADDDDQQGLDLAELVDQLAGADPAKPVKVITVALGQNKDSAALAEIAEATGTQPHSSERSYDIERVLFNAIFGL